MDQYNKNSDNPTAFQILRRHKSIYSYAGIIIFHQNLKTSIEYLPNPLHISDNSKSKLNWNWESLNISFWKIKFV